MEGRAVVWWSKVLHYGDGARQVSTRELDPHVFPDEVDWTPVTLSPERMICRGAGVDWKSCSGM